MNKKLIITINIVMLVVLIIFSLSNSVFAINPTEIIPDKVQISGTDTLYTLGNALVGIIQFVAVGVSVVATLVLAIKYMYSAPDEKAEIKKKLIPYIIGGFLVFGAVQLVKIAENIVSNV